MYQRWHCHTQSATDSICAGPCGRLRRVSRAPSCDFASQSSSCYSSGDLTTSSQVHLPSKATLSSAHFRPASLDIGLAFRWPISRARRQMRGDRIKCLGLRNYSTSCINATDSICRCARKESHRHARYYDEAKRIKNEMLKMINAQAKDPGLQKYQDIFRRHPERIFQWAENRSVPAENNMSECGVRRTVIARKVCGCDGPGHLHP